MKVNIAPSWEGSPTPEDNEWETKYGSLHITVGREWKSGDIRLDVAHDDDIFEMGLSPSLEKLPSGVCELWRMAQLSSGTAADELLTPDVFTITRSPHLVRMHQLRPMDLPVAPVAPSPQRGTARVV